jgi:transposase
MANEVLTVTTLAERFGVSIGTMRKWLASVNASSNGSVKTTFGRGRPALTYPASTIKLLERQKMAA